MALLTKLAIKIAFRFIASALVESLQRGGNEHFKARLEPYLEPYQIDALFDCFYTILYEGVAVRSDGTILNSQSKENSEVSDGIR